MAKEKNNKSRLVISIVSVSIPILAIIVTGVLDYGKVSNAGETNTTNIKDHKESVSKGFKYMIDHFNEETSDLKEEGCKPAQTSRTDIAVINTKLDTISAAQETKRKEDKESFKEILERLPK